MCHLCLEDSMDVSDMVRRSPVRLPPMRHQDVMNSTTEALRKLGQANGLLQNDIKARWGVNYCSPVWTWSTSSTEAEFEQMTIVDVMHASIEGEITKVLPQFIEVLGKACSNSKLWSAFSSRVRVHLSDNRQDAIQNFHNDKSWQYGLSAHSKMVVTMDTLPCIPLTNVNACRLHSCACPCLLSRSLPSATQTCLHCGTF